jgi:hypothetical protein
MPYAYADEVVATEGLEGTGTTEPTGTYTTPAVQDSADSAKGSNSGAQMMSYMMGGMFIATGTPMVSSCPSPSCPVGIMLIGMGIMSFMQGDENGDKSGQAAGTAGLTNSYGSTTGSGSSTGKNSSTVKAVEAQVKALETAGIVDTKTGTIKVPGSGKTYKTSDFASAESMAAAGFPAGAVAGAMEAASRAEKAAKKKLGALTAANGYAEGGGGGGAGGAGGAGADFGGGPGMGGSGLGGGAGKLNRDPAQVAGMQKNFNGEPIGVAADSIFSMMKRRYKVKDGQDSFITDMDLTLRK